MKKLQYVLCLIALLSFSAISASAATYSIFLDNLPNPSEIEAIVLNFEVGTGFDYIEDSLVLGEAAPPNNRAEDILFPWDFANPNPVADEGLFTIDTYNTDVLDLSPTVIGGVQYSDGLYNQNNLVDGLLLSFDYEGTLSLLGFSATNSSGFPVSYASLLEAVEITDGLVISQVPIPSSLLLLSGGLIGFAFCRRRKKMINF
jgi:hypothetical protein